MQPGQVFSLSWSGCSKYEKRSIMALSISVMRMQSLVK